MDRGAVALALTAIDVLCWIACFAWMFRISRKQNALLDEIKAQAKRIEGLSKEEHALIKEVHPKVGEIQKGVEEVKAVMKEDV